MPMAKFYALHDEKKENQQGKIEVYMQRDNGILLSVLSVPDNPLACIREIASGTGVWRHAWIRACAIEAAVALQMDTSAALVRLP